MQDKGNGEGTIYFRTDRKKWIAQYSDYDVMKDKIIRKSKSFEQCYRNIKISI